MTEQSHFLRMTWLVLLACVVGMTGCQVESSRVPEEEAEAQNPPTEVNPAEPSQLVIDTVSLPTTYPHATYSVRLQQHGGVPPFHWRIEKGELPRGMQLEDDGTLHGSPEIGEYRFTISLTHSSKPPQAVQRQYLLNVIEALSMTWKTPAHAVGNRIEGSVQVSNTTSEDFDITFIVLA